MKKSEELAEKILDDLGHNNQFQEGECSREHTIYDIAALIDDTYPDDLQTQCVEANKKIVKLMSEIDCLVDDNEALSAKIAKLEENE